MSKAKRIFSILIPIMLVSYLLAQWVPTIAKIRSTTEVIADDKVVSRNVKEGLFYRTEKGSTLTRWTRTNGVDQAGTGTLLDNEKLLTFQLDYATRNAKQSPYVLPEPVKPDTYSNTNSLGQSVVNGIPCRIIAVEIEGPQKPVERVGQACVSVEYRLLLSQKTNVTRKDRSTLRTTIEMYDVRLHVKPSAEEFDLDRNFSISRPERTLPIPSPRE